MATNNNIIKIMTTLENIRYQNSYLGGSITSICYFTIISISNFNCFFCFFLGGGVLDKKMKEKTFLIIELEKQCLEKKIGVTVSVIF